MTIPLQRRLLHECIRRNYDVSKVNDVPSAGEVLRDVYHALQEKGYNPVEQIVGFLISGEPTYITSYNNARSMIRRLDRDELIEELVVEYVKAKKL